MTDVELRSGHVSRRASIAIDLGAESCRVSLLRWLNEFPDLRLVHRFANGPVRASDGSLRWPLRHIIDGLETGIRLAAELAPEGIASLAVDGWAVDYVRLNHSGRSLEDPFCYRDERNVLSEKELSKHLSVEFLREVTGVEQQPINTLYQLYADKLDGKTGFGWLNLPEYLLYQWGGQPVAEYTNASHTQLLALSTASWSEPIFRLAGLDLACAPTIVPAGTALGKLSGELATISQLRDTILIAPACHDTASAIAGISEQGEDWAYISSGTWSLVGTLVSEPLNFPEVRADNFTNLGAVGGQTLFHKGINGMWILKQCMDWWAQAGHPWELESLLLAAELEERPPELLKMDDPALMGVGKMPGRINAQRRARGHAQLSEHGMDAPKMVCLILHSLAERYAEVIARVRFHTQKELRRVVMVGGGAQIAMLRRLTAERTGLEVCLGPAESSTIGNLAVQCAVLEGSSPAKASDFLKEVRFWASRIQKTFPNHAASRSNQRSC